MVRLAALIITATVLLAAGLWLLFDHVVAAWLPALMTFGKGITLKSLGGYGAVFLKRLFLVDLPRRAVTGYAFIFFLPPRAKVRLRRTVRRYRKAAADAFARARERHPWLFGRKAGLVIAATLSALVFLVGAVLLGWYVVVWIGSTELLRLLWRGIRYALGYVRDWFVKWATFLHLDKTAAALIGLVPERHRRTTRIHRKRLARHVIRLRTRAGTRAAQAVNSVRRRGTPATPEPEDPALP